MPDNMNHRSSTVPMDITSKSALFEQNHPIVRELKSMDQIIPGDHPVLHKQDCLPLKKLFLKENMDYYHVDCLILKKIALRMLELQMAFQKRGIFPGLYSMDDIYVDLSDSSLPLYMTHPEKVQLLNHEQDYEWYPEDERLLGDIILFDQKSQPVADQRFLYRILVAASKGNVKIPPRNTDRDYSALFYGTLPPVWKDVFEKENLLSYQQWRESLEESIAQEEYFEKKVKEENYDSPQNYSKTDDTDPVSSERKMNVIYILLPSEKDNSLDFSRLVYETQDRLNLEEEHGKFLLQQGFIYGDGVIKQKKLRHYSRGYRVQIPTKVLDYAKGEALLVGIDWMEYLMEEEADSLSRIIVISDGKISNDPMFKEVLIKAQRLQTSGCRIELILGGESNCEAWEQWKKKLNLGD